MIQNIDYYIDLEAEKNNQFIKRISNINSLLSQKYYEDNNNHTINVGSFGRKTATSGCSDYDVIFQMPDYVYTRINGNSSNGQSNLLQEIKNRLRETYSRTEIKGDGQVVDVLFRDGKIEIVPGFKNADGSFKFPDTHHEGSWKKTDPLSEIEEVNKFNRLTNGKYIKICKITRKWKNKLGFPFKGILIDTLVYDFFKENMYYSKLPTCDLFKQFLMFLSKMDKERKRYNIMGSNQVVEFDNKCIYKASQFLSEIESGEDVLEIVLGIKEYKNRSQNEEFIWEEFPMDIRKKVSINCKVARKGFRTVLLRHLLKQKNKIMIKSSLEFFIEEMDESIKNGSYNVYWKVKNRGSNSFGRERGEITKGSNYKIENSLFNGPHFVECYIVKNEIVVAKDRIDVPIN